MKFAILSDIHSNLEALEAVLRDADEKSVTQFIVLGDTVGYGANPNECFEWAVTKADVCLIGNHEKAVVDETLRLRFNEHARDAIVWTAKQMDSKAEDKIRDLPYRIDRDGVTFVHGSPDRPESFRYLFGYEEAESSFRHFDQHVCFVGHTHIPCCFFQGRRSAEHLKPGVVQLNADDRYILNPGSVGQPRDQDSRSAYGIYDDEVRTFELVRLEYENKKAAKKIRAAGLPGFLADRLL
ncbi:MAG: metallophosphoesterase family protein [Candidatus Omnitrophota bacterium]|nr:metallophosphoesterase family protein [Candidatus Omnitrophota bacterium]